MLLEIGKIFVVGLVFVLSAIIVFGSLWGALAIIIGIPYMVASGAISPWWYLVWLLVFSLWAGVYACFGCGGGD